MLKRLFALLCALICLCAGALAQETPAPSPTPEPIYQYSVGDVLAEGLDEITWTEPDETVYTFHLRALGDQAMILIHPAQGDRLQMTARIPDFEGSATTFSMQFAPDALYLQSGEEMYVLRDTQARAAMLMLTASATTHIALLSANDAQLEQDALALRALIESLADEFTRSGAFLVAGNHTIRCSVSLTQLLETLIRCSDKLLHNQALIDDLLARYVRAFIPEEYQDLAQYISVEGLSSLLSLLYEANDSLYGDFILSFTVRDISTQTQDHYTVDAELLTPLEGAAQFALDLTAPSNENMTISGALTLHEYDETAFALDIDGTVTDDAFSLCVTPRDYPHLAVSLDMSSDYQAALLSLRTPVGVLDAAQYRASSRDFRYTLRASLISGASIDAYIKPYTAYSRYRYQPTAHLGARYPMGRDVAYHYVTYEPGEGLKLKLGDALATFATVPNTENKGMRNVTRITFDEDVPDASNVINEGLLTTTFTETDTSMTLAQQFTDRGEITTQWSLVAAQAGEPAPMFDDALAQEITAEELIALPELLIRYITNPGGASDADVDETP